MKKLMLIALLSAAFGSAWGANMPEVDINLVQVPDVGQEVISVKAYQNPDGKFFLQGTAIISNQEKPFTARLLSDGETLDATYGSHAGINID